MTNIKLLVIGSCAALLVAISIAAVSAQSESSPEVPDPYAGLENPFPWDDPTAEEAGETLYGQYCLGCHGVDGRNLSGSDFGAADFPQRLEAESDFFFWVLSDGSLERGMPPYKSSLSEEQRWQVLTYLWSLSALPPDGPPPDGIPPGQGNVTFILIAAPHEGQSGEPLTLTAVLEDNQTGPIENARVKYYFKVEFFASGLMEIGEANTNELGVAVLEYVPRVAGDIVAVARYESDESVLAETVASISLAESDTPFYLPEAGLHLPAPGEEVFIGPQSAREVGEMGKAPTSAFRLPGGILSWLLLFVVVVMGVWAAYSLVMYQVLRISMQGDSADRRNWLVPALGVIAAIGTGILLALMILTGPDTHLHLR
jgi:mono/diheme cytochrome c family protein